MFDLKSKVAIVTGGNGGIGLGMARGLAQAGARVVVAARKREKSEAAVRELGGEALWTHRHTGEQRRHQYPQASARSATRGMEAGHGHQSHQCVPVLARRLS